MPFVLAQVASGKAGMGNRHELIDKGQQSIRLFY
jgi:hypothetical protein